MQVVTRACRSALFYVSHRKKYRRYCSVDCRDKEVVHDYSKWMLWFVWLTLMPAEIAMMTRGATPRRSTFTWVIPVMDLQYTSVLRLGSIWTLHWVNYLMRTSKSNDSSQEFLFDSTPISNLLCACIRMQIILTELYNQCLSWPVICISTLCNDSDFIVFWFLWK